MAASALLHCAARLVLAAGVAPSPCGRLCSWAGLGGSSSTSRYLLGFADHPLPEGPSGSVPAAHSEASPCIQLQQTGAVETHFPNLPPTAGMRGFDTPSHTVADSFGMPAEPGDGGAAPTAAWVRAAASPGTARLRQPVC